MAIVAVDYRAVTAPVGIVRFSEIFLACVAFSLVAHVGHIAASYWAWCMFTWCFCFAVTVLILLLEFTGLHAKIPISWDDFTTAFAMLATLMVFTASIIYPSFYIHSHNSYAIAATIMSILCFTAYTAEVVLTRAKPGEISGFLSTVPGLLKVLEAFVACIIFISLSFDKHNAGLNWCVAVYSLCFIFALVIIVFTICRLIALFPFSFDKVLTGYNILAVLMYVTAAVIWPLYSFQNNPRPNKCPFPCTWDKLVVVTFMTYFNLIVYIVDTVYSVRLVFFVSPA
ncbi:myeloid-associated differentiation marker homolog [Lepisosteus oculatus]|uniref:myeloid-associated differentiation marker homolog n=1 Tax=Lepisosteus oculatus TaxID=7918 RepID=UPI0035F500C0